MKIYLYNTLTRKKEEFKPIEKKKVKIYSCGPTVYWNQHIGHMFCYLQWGSLVKFFQYLGYRTKWVMNITDVGHLTSEADTGEDKMEKGAKREGLTVWKIAEKYTNQFFDSLELLNIQPPNIFSRATEHIEEQIKLIQKIEANGFTYRTKKGLVFDTSRFSGYGKFANLNFKKMKAGARVEVDPEKKQPWDFYLWIIGQPKHSMQWDSPWGRGFPGWHIECTAMSVKYLGKKFDIHTGGKEHIPVHHTNEIAQGYGAFGQQTANYWIHNEWLNLKGEKMSKSKGNFYTVQELKEKNYSPLAFRYLVLSSHYRKGLDFTWEALDGAQKALNNLYRLFNSWKGEKSGLDQKAGFWQNKFIEILADDLNWPKAMALIWIMIRDKNLAGGEKRKLLTDFDQVLGLKLVEFSRKINLKIPQKIRELVKKRDQLRKQKKWEEADNLRERIEELGFFLEDEKRETVVFPKKLSS